MTLLTELHQQKQARREKLRLETRAGLEAALRTLLPPGSSVVVFGSLVKPYRFDRWSDVDLALYETPGSLSPTEFAVQLETRLGRPADVVLLAETRLKNAILRTGEIWTL